MAPRRGQQGPQRRLSVLLGQLPCAASGEIAIEKIPGCTGGAVVHNVRIADLSDEAWKRIHQAFLEYGFLVFPNQDGLTKYEQAAFGNRFGKLEFAAAPVSNQKKDGSIVPATDQGYQQARLNEAWHSDSSFKPQSSKAALLFAEVVPPTGSGGETELCDTRAAYDDLDAKTKARIEGLSAYHSIRYSLYRRTGVNPLGGSGAGEYHPVASAYLRPIVKVHPETGRKSLFVPSHAFGVPGLSLEESEKLLDQLVDFAAKPPRTYKHTWTPGDLLIWDNRCFLHRACPYEDTKIPRVLRGTRIAGEPESESGLPAGFAAEALNAQLEHVRQTEQWVGGLERLR